MEFLDFERIPVKPFIGDKFRFQILTWHAEDEENEETDELNYKIYMFGCTENGENVCIAVNDYTPYFYIKVPENLQTVWDSFHTRELDRNLRTRFGDNIKKIELQYKINIKGFTNFKKEKYIKLIFINEKTYKNAKYYFRPIKKDTKKVDINKLPRYVKIDKDPLEFQIFEHGVEPYFRFCHRKDIQMAGWVEISSDALKVPNEFVSLCQYEFESPWAKINPCDEIQQSKLSPFIVASFDIECVPQNRKSFPDADNPEDIIFQIGTTFYREGSDKYLKHVLTIGSARDNYTSDPVDGVVVETFKTERQLLLKWLKIIKDISPDIITGYNIYNFDWTYISKRCRILKCENELSMLSRLVSTPAKMENIRFESSAYGTNYWHFLRIPGITNIDLHKIIKRDHKLESYKLTDVAHHFNGENKIDLTPEELFKTIDGSAKDIAKAVEYNAKDTELVAKLLQKLWILAKNISAANVSYIPLNYIEIKGQGIKIKSTTMHKCKKYDVLLPTADFNTDDCEDSFTGATVLDVNPGAYYKPISGLDFASLYPSIMISDNLCTSTIVYDKKYLNIPGLEYLKVDWTDNTGKECTATYVQNVKGILPQILEELWTERKKYKKMMKTAENKTTYNILNGIQLAIKVVMNSFYGILGASFGDLSERNIASTVTARGRGALQQAKHYVEKWYDCKVVYGDTDSIYVEFKTNKKGHEHFKEVFRISEEASKRISETFKAPMELEFEKIMYPFIIWNKKRYATVIWTNPVKYDYIDYKGISVTRRDFCLFVRDRASEILEKLLLHNIYKFDFDNQTDNINLAKNHAETIITKLLAGQVPIKELYISRSLRDGYKNQNIPHVALCRKMRERDPNNVPQIGDRVKYVFVQTGGPAKTQAEKVEDPDYVLKNGIPLDYYYYYEHQLKSTIESVLSNLGIDLDKFFVEFETKYKPIFTKWANKYAKEHAEANGLSLDDFPHGMKIKKQDVVDKLKNV